MLAMQFQLQHTQSWGPQRIEAQQLLQLGALLVHARTNVPFYRERLAGLDLHEAEPVARDLFAALPILTRRDVQSSESELVSRAFPSSHGRAVQGITSGSTGTPVRYRATELTQFFGNAFAVREHLWHHRDLAAKMLAIRAAPRLQELPGWFVGADGEPILATGPSVVVPLETPIDQQIALVLEHRPAYLLAYPSNLRELALRWIEEGHHVPDLKEVRTFGEAPPDDLAELIQLAWGVPWTDVYSAQECGYLACQCAERGSYHLQAESALIEVLDEDGHACPAGQTGRVVVTPLHNFAMPLLRYELGDYAEVGEPCACGRGLPVVRRILGRVRNMLTLPSGDKRWPRLGSRHRDIAPVRQLQVVQLDLDRVELRLVTARPLTGSEEAQLVAHLLDRLGHPFRITVTYLDRIPRTASGKYEDFRSELAPVP